MSRSIVLLVARGLTLAAVSALSSSPTLAESHAYITSCCFSGESVSFINNATNTESGFLSTLSPSAVAFSPDSATLYVALGSGTLRAVDVATRHVTATYNAQIQPMSLAISPDGGTAYVGDANSGQVVVLNLAQNQVVAQITVANSSLFAQCSAVAVSKDGSRVYAACQQLPVEAQGANYFGIIDATKNQLIETQRTAGGGSTASLALSPNGIRAYVTFLGNKHDGYVVIDVVTQKIIETLDLPSASYGLAFNPEGTILYSSGVGVVYGVIPNTAQVIHTIHVPSGQSGLAVAPDGELYVANFAHDSISVIKPASGEIVATAFTGALPSSLAISPDGKTTATANAGSTIMNEVTSANGNIVGTFEAGTNPAASVLTPDGKHLFVVDMGSTGLPGSGVMALDTQTHRRTGFRLIAGAATIGILPDGSKIYCGVNEVMATNNGSIAVVDPTTLAIETRIVLGTITSSNPNLAVMPNGTKLYSAYTDINGENILAVIDTATNTVTTKISLGTGASFAGPYVALSPDGNRAYVTLTNASELAIVDTVHDELLHTIAISPKYPVALAVHPSGKYAYLVSSLGFSGIVVLDLSTNTVTDTIRTPNLITVPFNVAFTPDGRYALLTEELGTVLIIDTATKTITGQVNMPNSLGITISAH